MYYLENEIIIKGLSKPDITANVKENKVLSFFKNNFNKRIIKEEFNKKNLIFNKAANDYENISFEDLGF